MGSVHSIKNVCDKIDSRGAIFAMEPGCLTGAGNAEAECRGDSVGSGRKSYNYAGFSSGNEARKMRIRMPEQAPEHNEGDDGKNRVKATRSHQASRSFHRSEKISEQDVARWRPPIRVKL